MIEEDISKINSYEEIKDALKRHPELETIRDVKTNWMSLSQTKI